MSRGLGDVYNRQLIYGTTPDIAEQVTYVDDLTGSAAYKKYLAGIVFTLGR